MNRVDNLIEAIDNSSIARDIKILNKKILEDRELVTLLEQYAYDKSDKLKKMIISNMLFQEYKEKETDINLLIMSINQKLKSISSKGSCHR